jgi:hypothetical protein
MFIVELQGKSPLGIPAFRWVDAIEMDLRDTKLNELTQGRVQQLSSVSAEMNLQVFLKPGKKHSSSVEYVPSWN